MIRSKIDPANVGLLTWKEYCKLLDKDLKQAESKGLEQVPLVVITKFKFACGEEHALLLLGKQSPLTKFFKSLKADPERKKAKDFGMGTCVFEQEPGQRAVRLFVEGFAKPNAIKRHSKKTAKKLGLDIREITKGTPPVAVKEPETIDQPSTMERKEEPKGDEKKTGIVKQVLESAKAFLEVDKLAKQDLVAVVKQGDQEEVLYTTDHLQLAEEIVQATKNFVQQFEQATEDDGSSLPPKVTTLKTSVDKNKLVQKYEIILRKIEQGYQKQMKDFDPVFVKKWEEYRQLMKEIEDETPSA